MNETEVDPISVPVAGADAGGTPRLEPVLPMRFSRRAVPSGGLITARGEVSVGPTGTPVSEYVTAVPASAGPFLPSAWRLLDRRALPWLRFAVDVVLLLVVAAVVVTPDSAAAHVGPLWVYPLLPPALMAARGLYSQRVWDSTIDVVFAAFGAVSIATMAYVTAIAFAGYAALPVVAQLWILSIAVVCGAHAALLLARRFAQRNGRIGGRALIVGAGVVGRRVARRLDEHPEFGITPVGLLDVGPTGVVDDGAPPIVGAPHELVQTAQRMGADHVILAFSRMPDRDLVNHIRHCEAAGLQVSLVPRLFESMGERFEIQRLGALPLLALRTVDPKGWQFALKYQLDRALAALLLLMAGPVLLLVAVLVRLSSQGPVFFRQRRVGLDGQVFDLLKFRSMYMSDQPEEFRPAAGLAPGGIEGVDRRTPLGRVLRRTFLDELPQLINVLRGEMSLVGPRPERPEFVELFADEVSRYVDRHRAKSGITGLAQVHGLRGQTSVADRIELDNHYIDTWSLMLDLKILLMTVAAVFSNRADA